MGDAEIPACFRTFRLPTPDRSRIDGVVRVPQERTTNFLAFTVLVPRTGLDYMGGLARYSTAHARPPSNMTLSTCDSTRTWMFGCLPPCGLGCKYVCAASCHFPSGDMNLRPRDTPVDLESCKSSTSVDPASLVALIKSFSERKGPPDTWIRPLYPWDSFPGSPW